MGNVNDIEVINFNGENKILENNVIYNSVEEYENNRHRKVPAEILEQLFPEKQKDRKGRTAPNSVAFLQTEQFRKMREYDPQKKVILKYQDFRAQSFVLLSLIKSMKTQRGSLIQFVQLSSFEESVLIAIFTILCARYGKMPKTISSEGIKITIEEIYFVMTGKPITLRDAKEDFNIDNYKILSMIHDAVFSLASMRLIETQQETEKYNREELKKAHNQKISIITTPKTPQSWLTILHIDGKAVYHKNELSSYVYTLMGIPAIFIKAEEYQHVARFPFEATSRITREVGATDKIIQIRYFTFQKLATLCNGNNTQKDLRIYMDEVYDHLDNNYVVKSGVDKYGYYRNLEAGRAKHAKIDDRASLDKILLSLEGKGREGKNSKKKGKNFEFATEPIIFGDNSTLISHKFIRDENRRGKPIVAVELTFDAETTKMINNKPNSNHPIKKIMPKQQANKTKGKKENGSTK